MQTSGLAYCGLNCDNCPTLIATANNDDNLKQETAREWSQIYGEYLSADLKPEDMSCSGCRSESELFVGCQNCPIRRCCSEKQFSTCADCGDYDTCGMLNGFFAIHPHTKDNLDRIRANQ